MNPSESESFADIVLTMSDEAYKLNKATVDNLQKGDHLNFKARIRSMGNEFKLHHLRLVGETGSLIDTGKSEDYDHISVAETKLP